MSSNTALLDKIDRQEKTQSRWKMKAKESAERVVNTVAVVAGGAAAGWLDAKYADKKVMGMNLPTVVGLAALAVGITGMVGAYSDGIGFFGAGIMSVEAYKFTLKKTSNGNVSGYIGAAQRAQMGAGNSPVTVQSIREQMRSAA